MDERPAEFRRRNDFLQILLVGNVAAPGRHAPHAVADAHAGVHQAVRITLLLGEVALTEGVVGEQVRHQVFLHGAEPGLADERRVETRVHGPITRQRRLEVDAGIAGVLDLRGTPDALGRVMQVTEIAVADELACAAELVMGKSNGIPVGVVRGADAAWFRESSMDEIVRNPSEDLFR